MLSVEARTYVGMLGANVCFDTTDEEKEQSVPLSPPVESSVNSAPNPTEWTCRAARRPYTAQTNIGLERVGHNMHVFKQGALFLHPPHDCLHISRYR
eukprot:352785-Chlamydomonas_euryale.AAC.3